jgi:hypothetical protein
MANITSVVGPVDVSTDKDTHFTGSIAQNAKEDENITGLGFNSGLVVTVTIISDQNLSWDVYFWGTDGADDTSDLDNEKFLGRVSFAASDGDRIGAANQYRYTTNHSNQPYQPIRYIDLDGTEELHVSLVNRSGTSKNAGATGEVVVQFVIDPDKEAPSPTV